VTLKTRLARLEKLAPPPVDDGEARRALLDSLPHAVNVALLLAIRKYKEARGLTNLNTQASLADLGPWLPGDLRQQLEEALRVGYWPYGPVDDPDDWYRKLLAKSQAAQPAADPPKEPAAGVEAPDPAPDPGHNTPPAPVEAAPAAESDPVPDTPRPVFRLPPSRPDRRVFGIPEEHWRPFSWR
jgi:hypothetical protein